MHCLFRLSLGVAVVLLTGSTTFDAHQPRPNILVLFADDMRADAIGAYGNPHIQTPNIDRLVGAGFSFRGNYVFGGDSGAVCVASRAMLMSGRTWFNADTVGLKGARLLPELLGEQGYETFGTGKWHNGQPSWLRAFQRGKTIMFGGMSDHTRVPVRDLASDGKLTAERTGEKFSSELFADSAIEFLDRRDRKKPFFAYVAFTAPHDPRQPPLSYREPYYRSLPPLPANFLPQLPYDNGMVKDLRDEDLAAWPRRASTIRDQLAEYYGLITHMDEQIQRCGPRPCAFQIAWTVEAATPATFAIARTVQWVVSCGGGSCVRRTISATRFGSIGAFMHEALLPSSEAGLGPAGPGHDRRGAQSHAFPHPLGFARQAILGNPLHDSYVPVSPLRGVAVIADIFAVSNDGHAV
jgi:hypothetical protein